MAGTHQEHEAGDSDLQRLASGIPEDWLIGVAEREARRLTAMTADLELLDRLMFSGYEGREYDKFADRLVRYGHAVIYAWCANGDIYLRCAALGRAVRRAPISPDDAEALADETVAQALIEFRRRVLIPHRWDPRKGASITTYFVGQCPLRFSNVYKRWRHETKPLVLLGLDDDDELPIQRQLEDPHAATEHHSLRRVEAQQAFTSIDDDLTQRIVLLKADQYSNDEIAELCAVSLAVVKTRLYRLQKDSTHVA